MAEDNRLKLRAITAEDIKVLSALLQDGLVAASDMHYEKSENSFLMVINRFCWEQANEGESEIKPNRCLCGLMVGHVKNVSQRGFSAKSTQFYNLLSITYEETKENEKAVNSLTFTFSDGYDIRLAVDELAVIVQDIAAPHPALAQPQHKKN